ncbi:PilT protein domain protein [Nostoc linckia z18]|uniref:PilT protein domain protein n=2 Tax=Nostoc linckia TaxID=92942 RepID=A0A9Q5Z4R3_NOSLI|nr:type II toxin-antitoxin system VapC family toxin [Nostoc linckia]PHK34541.1 PilT protein domain protein [Nostoc linckia z15]PHK41417.1 PilT protein domain protein [Nostoc linckia z16]PHJ57135.1 PilT protein domain protein [Nostoc linckia z3]PHJ58312.1 PilT protein domain protein [Nostoc linckia z1]PHJ58455.1 PilT protein domain protein [Nostoc linckia z2]
MSNPLRCVIDTSVCIKYFIADPLTTKVNQLLGHLANPQTEIYVPDLFYIECTNVLLKYVRARMYTAAEVQTDLVTLKSFPLRVVSTADLMADAVSIGLTHKISAYDGSYVALSQQVGAILLTLDAKLVKALSTSSYNICLFNDFQVP